MIDKVSFAGREGLLTGNIKQAAQKKPVTNYITESTILPKMKEETKAVAPDISSEKLNEAYRAAHAPYSINEAYKTAYAPYTNEQPKTFDDIFDPSRRFILDGQQY